MKKKDGTRAGESPQRQKTPLELQHIDLHLHLHLTRQKRFLVFSQLGLSQDQHITLPSPIANCRSPIADRQKKVMARTKQTARKQPLPSQFGGKQPRTIPAPPPPPPPPQKLHECLAIIEQKTEPHYKAVACIDNKNIRVPKKELCKSVEATIDRVIQSCWTDYFISDSDVYFVPLEYCHSAFDGLNGLFQTVLLFVLQ